MDTSVLGEGRSGRDRRDRERSRGPIKTPRLRAWRVARRFSAFARGLIKTANYA
jgi:hypothetical protein